MIELPTGSYSRGLGVRTTWYKLPLWIQKDFEPELLMVAADIRSSIRAATRTFLTRGGCCSEILATNGHWAVSFGITRPKVWRRPDTRRDNVDFGGYYYFKKPAFQLLFSIGHTVIGAA